MRLILGTSLSGPRARAAMRFFLVGATYIHHTHTASCCVVAA